MNPGTGDALVERVLAEYALPAEGVHGPVHWARVLENGTRLAERNGTDLEIVQLFALFHDSRRVNEAIDHGHGARGAEFAETLRGELIHLDDERFELLRYACIHHTDGMTDGPRVVRTCWDADRLDLGRVYIRPKARYLCTGAAREPDMMRWADDRACDGHVPEIATRWLSLDPRPLDPER
ncbi:MAG: hypothetical protein R3266_01500 [Gemmatimonadota bacterium]|nr:hypothetical protein [Gemmatimonadota bacterium]